MLLQTVPASAARPVWGQSLRVFCHCHPTPLSALKPSSIQNRSPYQHTPASSGGRSVITTHGSSWSSSQTTIIVPRRRLLVGPVPDPAYACPGPYKVPPSGQKTVDRLSRVGMRRAYLLPQSRASGHTSSCSAGLQTATPADSLSGIHSRVCWPAGCQVGIAQPIDGTYDDGVYLVALHCRVYSQHQLVRLPPCKRHLNSGTKHNLTSNCTWQGLASHPSYSHSLRYCAGCSSYP